MKQDLIRPFFSEDFSNAKLESSLKYLTQALQDHHAKQVVFLLDEYDTPLHKAYEENYFPEVIDMFRNMLGAALRACLENPPTPL